MADILEKIIKAAESHFEEEVIEASHPGGEDRASMRLTLKSRSVIATKRPNFRRTHLEALVLSRLHKAGADVPDCLGLVDDILFQTDLGGQRLNAKVHDALFENRRQLAESALDAIFRNQSIAKSSGVSDLVPPLGATPNWVEGVLQPLKDLALSIDLSTPRTDYDALFVGLNQAPQTFLKWDCRSGNAAVSNGKVAWFDFEYAGRRHGAEDPAWLIADEVWPVGAPTMFDLVERACPAVGPDEKERYMNYLALYTTCHAAQRLSMIQDSYARKGWIKRSAILARDFLGTHYQFATHLSGVGAFAAERNRLTRPFVPVFEALKASFEKS